APPGEEERDIIFPASSSQIMIWSYLHHVFTRLPQATITDLPHKPKSIEFISIEKDDQQETFDLGSSDNEDQQEFPIYNVLAPKKKRTVYIWACCCCPTSGMKVSTVDCPGCGTPRCPYCRVEKKTIRG
ncbi:unnamed protein product, partial [Fusarium graminearum]